MCYYLCILRWLMRPILALNSLLQKEQERSERESSVGDALALAFRCARFCSASLILFAAYSLAPLLTRPSHFVRSCAICSHDSVSMLKSLREALRGCPCIASSDHHGSVFQLVALYRGFSLANRSSGFKGTSFPAGASQISFCTKLSLVINHKLGRQSSNDHKCQIWFTSRVMQKMQFNHFPIKSLWDLSVVIATKQKSRSP